MEKKSKNSQQNESNSSATFTCEWCNKSFYNIYNLKVHVETAKYCLKLRGEKKTNDTFECEYCHDKFSIKSRFSKHMETCSKLEIIRLKKEMDSVYSILKERDACVEKLNKHIEKQAAYMKDIEIKLAKGEAYMEGYKESKPQQNITNFNSHHKIKNILTTTIPPLTINLVKENVRNNYTYELFCKGEQGLIDFIKEITIKKDANLIEQNYACTDPSRNDCHILTHKDPDNWKKDFDSKFINKILDELVEPVEQYYERLRDSVGNITDIKIPAIDGYIRNPKLNFDQNLAAEELYKKEILVAQQNLDKQKARGDILENINPVYYGITSEDKREELFKRVRGEVKKLVSI